MSKEESREISLEIRFESAIKRAKEVRDYIREKNNGCEPSLAECLAYDMQYIEKYVQNLQAEIENLKEIEAEHKKQNAEIMKKLSTEEMINDIKIGRKVYRNSKEKEELKEQIKEAELRRWNDITVEIKTLKKAIE